MAIKTSSPARKFKRNNPITARRLNNLVQTTNDQRGVRPPSNNAFYGTFREVSRSYTEVEVTDSNGDTHDIEQIDRVKFVNGTGQQLILIFKNPT